VRTQQFTALFETHYDRVLTYALRRTDPHRASDVAAEVFLVVWRRLDEVPTDALPWLIATARRVLANQRRSTDRVNTLQLRLGAERPLPAVGLDEQVGIWEQWRTALGLLTPADQEVLALVAWDGLTAREAAASLGCSVPAVVMRLHRARRRLAGLLDLSDESSSRAHPRRDATERTAL